MSGTIGHVAHGKSTVVKAISGVMTVRFKNELVRNITIKLGYANAKVRPRTPSASTRLKTESLCRSTSARTPHAQDQAATGHIDLTRKTTRPASGQDVAIA